MLLLTQTNRHLIDLTVEDAQLALRIIIKIDRAFAVQNLIDIIRKGRNPLIPLVSADAEDQHKQQRKNDSRQSGTEVEHKAEGTGNYGDGKLPQQWRRAPLCFSKASSCVHLVSYPADRLNDFRLGGVVLDLLTQTLDIYRQRIVIYIGSGNIPH